MKIKSLLQFGFTLTLLSSAMLAIADNERGVSELLIKPDNVVIPITNIQQANKTFTFDWNNEASISANKNKIAAVESVLKNSPNYTKMSNEERDAKASLLYKLGTYYTHVTRQPDLAIRKLDEADDLLTNKADQAWNINHLAYAYELKYAKTNNEADKNKALDFTHEVITDLNDDAANKQDAFAYTVRGLVQNDAKDYPAAEDSLKKALAIYEKVPDGKDNQYERTKNRLATIILEQDGREKEAITMLQEVKTYWDAKPNVNSNPYAARNLIALGQAHLKTGDNKAALDELTRGIGIYKKVYGLNSPQLIQPYDLLADAYKTMGNDKEVEAYLQKATALDKG